MHRGPTLGVEPEAFQRWAAPDMVAHLVSQPLGKLLLPLRGDGLGHEDQRCRRRAWEGYGIGGGGRRLDVRQPRWRERPFECRMQEGDDGQRLAEPHGVRQDTAMVLRPLLVAAAAEVGARGAHACGPQEADALDLVRLEAPGDARQHGDRLRVWRLLPKLERRRCSIEFRLLLLHRSGGGHRRGRSYLGRLGRVLSGADSAANRRRVHRLQRDARLVVEVLRRRRHAVRGVAAPHYAWHTLKARTGQPGERREWSA
mmetsp:Transcript_9765/g.29781  ORF Transcript_9765/g.29781 Transcript_9765/m.29781 type:complete len:257 (-) Transcript_9765:3457-4227(-)